MRNNRSQRRGERSRHREYELRQDRERRDPRGRYDSEWRPREGSERMAEERRTRRGRTSGYADRNSDHPKYTPEYDDRPRWDRQEWGGEPSYPAREDEARYNRRHRDENDEDSRYREQRHLRDYDDTDFEYPEREHPRSQDDDRQSDGLSFRARDNRSGANGRRWYWEPDRYREHTERDSERGDSFSFSRGSGDFGPSERHSATNRFQGYEFWDGRAGGDERYSTLSSSWDTESSTTQRQGNHVGKGPRGYSRSDDRIKEDVSEALQNDPMIDASDITVQVDSGLVTLSGTVDSRRAKRLAEDVSEYVSGVKDVQNQIRVSQPGNGEQQSTLAPGQTGKEIGSDTSKVRYGSMNS